MSKLQSQSLPDKTMKLNRIKEAEEYADEIYKALK